MLPNPAHQQHGDLSLFPSRVNCFVDCHMICIRADCSAKTGLALHMICSSVNRYERSCYYEALLGTTVVYRYKHEQLPRVKALLSFASTASDLKQVDRVVQTHIQAIQVYPCQVKVLLHSHVSDLCMCRMGIALVVAQ